jgi:PAP2 superfamily
VVVFRRTRNVWSRTIAVIVTAVIPVVVALSRMYRGMHFLSDVVGGALLGGAAVVLTVTVLKSTPHVSQANGNSRPSTTDGMLTSQPLADDDLPAPDRTAPPSVSNPAEPAMSISGAADADR